MFALNMLLAEIDWIQGQLQFWIWLVFCLCLVIQCRLTSLHKKVDQILENQNGGDDTDASDSE
jgi:hypothetical protein